jgi:hypothetical protein
MTTRGFRAPRLRIVVDARQQFQPGDARRLRAPGLAGAGHGAFGCARGGRVSGAAAGGEAGRGGEDGRGAGEGADVRDEVRGR